MAAAIRYYIARRITRMASRGHRSRRSARAALALDAWQIYERLGSPEGELAIAEAVVYLAVRAEEQCGVCRDGRGAWRMSREFGTLEVPLRLRNAPTRLMKDLGYGQRLSLRAR